MTRDHLCKEIRKFLADNPASAGGQTPEQIAAMSLDEIVSAFLRCDECQQPIARLDEVFCFLYSVANLQEWFAELHDVSTHHICAVTPSVTPSVTAKPAGRQKPICDLRAIAERRSGRMLRRSPELLFIKTGQRFGKLTAVRPARGFAGEPRWICRCDCEHQQFYSASLLVNGRITACLDCR
jgi:hypothetical protein